MKNLAWNLICIVLFMSVIYACEKNNSEPVVSKTVFEMNIGDARTKQLKSNLELLATDNDIIEASKLSKFEVSISKIELKDAEGNFIEILNTPTLVDLRQFKGTIKDLLAIEINSGKYASILVSIDGVNITYDANNYNASSNGAEVTIGAIGYTVNSGLQNPFLNPVQLELPFEFEITDTTNYQAVRLFFDAEASCKTIAIDVPTLGVVYFAGIRDHLLISAILENNIQQIKHSPPLDIQLTSTADFSYYGIHTFVDFAKIGGEVTSHTSQHVFRGADGSLLIDAEEMAINDYPLIDKNIKPEGETDIKADELFRYTEIKTNLAAKGYNLESGKVYYFSLRKTWNILTGGKSYQLTRICEPIPVYCP